MLTMNFSSKIFATDYQQTEIAKLFFLLNNAKNFLELTENKTINSKQIRFVIFNIK